MKLIVMFLLLCFLVWERLNSSEGVDCSSANGLGLITPPPMFSWMTLPSFLYNSIGDDIGSPKLENITTKT